MVTGPAPTSVSGQTITWTLNNLAVGASVELIFRAAFPIGVDCIEYTNTVSVTGKSTGHADVHASDYALIEVLCGPPDDEPDGHLYVHKMVKPDCMSNVYYDSISFDEGQYDEVTYRIEVFTNVSLLTLSVRDSIPQIDGWTYNNSYVTDAGGNFIDPAGYVFAMTDNFFYWNFTYVAENTRLFIYYCMNVDGCGYFNNTANATGFYYFNGPCCPTYIYDEDTAIVRIICPHGITFEKEASLDGVHWVDDVLEADVGDVIWFRLTLTNLGTTPYYGVNIYDYLPDFMTFKEVVSDDNADTFENHTHWLRWFYQMLNDSIVIIFKATVVEMGVDENLACVADCVETDICDSVLIDVAREFIEKHVSLDNETWVKNTSAANGGTVWWNITITYTTPIENLTLYRIVITDILPEGVSYVSGSGMLMKSTGWKKMMNPQITNQTLVWNLTNVPGAVLSDGEWMSAIFKTTVNVPTNGLFVNWVNVTGWKCNDTFVFGRDSASIYVSSELMDCEKSVRKGTSGAWLDDIEAAVGDTISFNVSLINLGSMPMHHIAIHDYLPASLSYVENSAKLYYNGSYSNCEPSLLTGNVLFWSHINECLPGNQPGEEAEYIMQGKRASMIFDVEVISTGLVTNTAEINGTMCSQNIPVACSDTATVNISIAPLVATIAGPSQAFIDDVNSFTGSATGGVPPYTLSWDMDNDGQYDDATGTSAQKTWTTAGTYTIGLKVVDSRNISDTETKTITIKTRVANLACYGTLSWVNVSQRDTITGEFTVRNVGDPKSKLDWEIESMPDWGTWSASPLSGTDLTPEQGSITVVVTVEVPRGRNKEYYGNVTVVNSENPSDSAVIAVSCATPRTWSHPFLEFIQQFLERFPILQRVFDGFRL
jgi:uncharacterized repeat protein (TIGR01451 family)